MKKLTLLVLSALIVSCATNPLTGRKALALVDNSQIFPQAFAQYTTVLKESKLSADAKQSKMIKDVGAKLRSAAEKFYTAQGLAQDLQGYAWEFNLIESKEINAWCMPGGKVAFYTGIMPICKDETGVAVVMGHEIAHALAGHGAERMSQGILAQTGGSVVGASISNDKWRQAFAQYYPIAGQLTLLSYGRKQELDADKAGLFLMAMAGYDPRQAPEFWNRMNSATSSDQRPPQFLSTHPDPERRIADINSNMNQALQYYTQATGKK